MRYTASALKILSRRYRSVLLKCALLNAGLLLAASPAKADALSRLKAEIARPTNDLFSVGNFTTDSSLGTLGSNGGRNILRLWIGNIRASGSVNGIVVPQGKVLQMTALTFGDGGEGNFTGFDIQNDSTTDYYGLILAGVSLNTGITGTGTTQIKAGAGEAYIASLSQKGLNIVSYARLRINASNLSITDPSVLNDGVLNLTGGTLTANVTGYGRTLINGNVTTTAGSLQQDVEINGGFSLTANADMLGSPSRVITVTNSGALNIAGSADPAAPLVAYANISNTGTITVTGHAGIIRDIEGNGGSVTIDATTADASLTVTGNWIMSSINATGGNTASLIIDGTGYMNNRGALNVQTTVGANKKMNTNASLIGAALTNNGSLELRGGATVQPITNNGQITLANNTSLGDLTGTGSVSNNMTLTLTGATNTNTINGTGRIIIDNAVFETTGPLNQAVTINADKQLTAAANLIGGTVTNNGTIVLNSGLLSVPVYGGTTQIAPGQEVTASAFLTGTAVDNYGVLNVGFDDLFGDWLNDWTITNRAGAELYADGDGALTRTINGDGKTYLNGNIIWDDGSVSLGDTILQSGSMTVEAIADVHGELRMNGKLTMELYEVSANFSGYAGGKLVVHETFTVSPNTTLELVVDSDTMRVGESTGDLVLIDAAGYEGDFAALAYNNRYALTKVANGTYRLTYVDTAAGIAYDVGANTGAASAWDRVDPRNAPTSTGAAIAERLNQLSQYNKVAYGRALDNLTPTNASTVASVSTGVLSLIGNAVSARVDAVSGMSPVIIPDSNASSGAKGRSGGDAFSEPGVWGKLLFNRSKQDRAAGTVGFKGDTTGVVFGADGRIADNVMIGVGYAYSTSDITAGGRDIKAEGRTAFAYTQYKPSYWFARASLSYGKTKYDEKTIVAGVGVKAGYSVYTAAANLTGGYDFDNGITPEGGVRFNRITRRSYTDSAGQRTAKDNMNLTTLVAGSRFGKAFRNGKFEWSASANAALTYDLSSDKANSVVFVGNSVYSVEGRRLSRWGGEAGVGAQTSYEDWDFSLNYDYAMKTGFRSHTVSLKAEYNF